VSCEISIIVLSFNREKLLVETVRSILNQTFKDFELIIINDGSTDNTEVVVRSFEDERIRYISRERSGNLSTLRNLGISLAKGNYISFCDDDDLWRIDKLEIQKKYLEEFDAVCSNSIDIDFKGNVIKELHYTNFTKDFKVTNEYLMSNGNMVLTPSLIFKKKIIENMKSPFDEKKFTNYCEDFNFVLKLTEKSDIIFINKPLIYVRFHESISSGVDNNIKMVKAGIEILNEYKSKYEESKIKKKNINKGIIEYKIYLLKLYYKKNLVSGLKGSICFVMDLAEPGLLKAFLYKIKKRIDGNQIGVN